MKATASIFKMCWDTFNDDSYTGFDITSNVRALRSRNGDYHLLDDQDDTALWRTAEKVNQPRQAGIQAVGTLLSVFCYEFF